MSSIFNDIYAVGQRYAPAPLPPKPNPQQAAPPPYPGYLSPADRQAQADQQTHTLYDPVLGVYRQQQQRQQLMELAQQAGLAKLYDVLGGSLAGFSGQVQGVYDQAGSALTGSNYDQGYQHGAQIAAQGLQGQGAGFANAAGALPAISGQQGAVKYLTAVQQAHADDQKLQDLIDSTAAEMPGKTQEFLYGINRDQTGLQNSYASVQLKQAAIAQKNGQVGLAQAWKVANQFTTNSSHVYVATVDKNGNPTVVDAGPKVGSPKSSTFKGTDGRTYRVDPATGQAVAIPGQSGPKKPGSSPAAKPTTFQGTDGQQYTVDPKTGVAKAIPGQPGPQTKTPKAPAKTIIDPVTGVTLTKDKVTSYSSDVWATIKDGRARGWNLEDILPHLKNSPVPREIWAPIIAKAYRIPPWVIQGVVAGTPQAPSKLMALNRMGVGRLHGIAAFLGFDFSNAPRGAGFSKGELIRWIVQNVPQRVPVKAA